MIKIKKAEAQLVAIEKSKTIIGYINDILADEELKSEQINPFIATVNINFGYYTIEGKSMCTLDISVPKKRETYDKHLNLGIEHNNWEVLYEQVLSDLLVFLESDSVGLSNFSVEQGIRGGTFAGVHLYNLNNCHIKINFKPYSDKLIEDYNRKYKEISNSLEKGQSSKMGI